jgi:hypothetical protein
MRQLRARVNHSGTPCNILVLYEGGQAAQLCARLAKGRDNGGDNE